jgi:hypothetical protein
MSLEFIARNGIISRGNIIVTGSLTASGSLALTNIGSSVFSGSITQIASTASFGGLVGIGTTTPSASLDIRGTQIATGSIARTMLISSSLSASANSNTLVGLDINPTFITGSFTGVDNIPVRITNGTFTGNNTSFLSLSRIDGSTAVIGNRGGGWNEFGIWGGSRFSTSAAPDLAFSTAGAITSRVRFIVEGSNNLLVGTSTDSGFKLDVNGTGRFSGNLTVSGSATNSLLVKSSGATSATAALRVQNSAGNSLFIIGDAGAITATEGDITTNTVFALGLQARINQNMLISAPWADSTNVTIQTITNKAQVLIVRPDANLTLASGTHDTQRITHTFAPTSGTAVVNGLTLNQTINQTSGANGITRGLYVNPTLTSASDFRAIETTTGSVTFGGNTQVTITGSLTVVTGSTVEFQVNQTGVKIGNATTDLHSVTGSLSISSSVGSALTVYKSGSTVVDIQGSQGSLMSVEDSLTGSLMSVGNISGLPLMEVFDDGTMNAGKFNVYPIRIVATGSQAVITGSFTGSFSGNITATTFTASSALVTGNVTVLGTASINNLIINQIGYSSGSNQLGDAVDDTQTFYGTVIIPTGSLTVNGDISLSGSRTIKAVTSGSTNTGASLTLRAGNATTGSSYTYGGSITIQGGDSLSPVGAGGDVYIYGGAPAGGQRSGYIYIGAASGQYQLYLQGAPIFNWDGPNNSNAVLFQRGGSTRFRIYDDVNLTSNYYFRGAGTNAIWDTWNTVIIRGSGTTSSTTAFQVQNVNATASLVITDDRKSTFGGDVTIASNNLFIRDAAFGSSNIYLRNPTGIYFEGNATQGVGSIKFNPIAYEQYGVAINSTGTTNPPASAVLALNSSLAGFLLTRHSSTSAISSPAQGIQTYITASGTEGIWYYNSGSYQGWTRVLNDSGSQVISGSLSVVGTGSFITPTSTVTIQDRTDAINGTAPTISSTGVMRIGTTSNTLWIAGSTVLIGNNGSQLGIAGDTITPNYDGTGALGTTAKYWGNAYINQLLVRTSARITGSLAISGSASTSSAALSVYKSGSTVVDIQGSSGQLFSVTDSLTGSLFSVNTVAGLPVMEAFSDNTVNIGKFNTYPIKVVATGSLANITGSFSGSLVGSVTGTTTTASFALTASYVNPLIQNVLVTGSISSTSIITGTGTNNYTGIVSTAAGASATLGYGGVGATGGTTFDIFQNNSAAIAIAQDKNVGIGAGSGNAAYGIARLLVKGSGTTSSTTSLLVQNANASASLSVRDDGKTLIGVNSGQLLLGTLSTNTNAMSLLGYFGNGTSCGFYIQNQNSGTIKTQLGSATYGVYIDLTQTFANGASRGGLGMTVGGTINNTGTSTGDVGGYSFEPIITSLTGSEVVYAFNSTVGGAYINTSTRQSTAILQADSTTKGFLPPRTNVTSNISAPAQGLMTYVTASTTEGLYYYNSGSYQGWTRVLNNSGSQSISGSVIIDGGLFDTTSTGSLATGSTLVYSVDTGSYTAGFFDYYAVSGSNGRAGTVMSFWLGGQVQYTDNSTPDVGNTSNIAFSMSLAGSSAQLFASASSAGWNVKTSFRTI